MLESISACLLLLTVITVLLISPDLIRAFTSHLKAQTGLLNEQAAHVRQTAQAELEVREATIKAHEQNGRNKLRGEIKRAAGDLAKIEGIVGFSLDLKTCPPVDALSEEGANTLGQEAPDAAIRSKL